jgi:hypothetical protein
MRLGPLLWVLLAARPVAAQTPPALIPEPGKAVRSTLGGRGSAFRIESAILRQTRHIDVALPASFSRSSPSRHYPVIVAFDGEAYLAPLSAVSEELSRHGLIPEAIVVGIENEGDSPTARVYDLTPPGLSVSGSDLNQGGDAFLDFVEKELLPAVDRAFRGGLPRTLIGHSSGGVLATYAAATRPGFRTVVAIDAPVHLSNNWLPERLISRAKADRTALRFAYFQARFPWPDSSWSSLIAAAPSTWKLTRERFAHEAHETAFMLGAYLGLREVFSEYSRLAPPAFPTTSKLAYYDSLTPVFGAVMIPPQRVLRDVIEDLAIEGRGPAARDAYRTLMSAYGAPADSAEMLSAIADAEARPAPTETVEQLLGTPSPTQKQAQAFLGEWASTDGASGSVLRFTAVDGKVEAEVENPNAPPALRVRRMQYVQVTSKGISFGIMNGMRPYGLILYEMVLHGDTLSGRRRWGGISDPEPPGGPQGNRVLSFVRRRTGG